MVKTVTKTYCDICEKETSNSLNINYPVIWFTEGTEGRYTIPYISNEKIDVCRECASKILKVSGSCIMDFHKYELYNNQEFDKITQK